MATATQRRHIYELIGFLRRYAGQLDYPPGDQRTGRDAVSWHLTEQQAEHVLAAGGRLQLDCSELWSWLLRAVGCWHWPTPGYTGSHLATLPVYLDPKLAGIGAGVVFGPGTGHHEAAVYQPDPKHGNPLLCSHGRPGLDIISLRDEEARQTDAGHPGVRLLSIANL